MNKTSDSLVFKTGKLVIAAAWADGKLDNSEVNALKELLFSLPDLNAHEWSLLEIYMDSPVEAHEVEVLLNDVVEHIQSDAEKKLVLDALENLIAVDGNISEEEKKLFADIKKAIDEKKIGIVGLLSRLSKRVIGRRQDIRSQSKIREKEVDNFIRNKVLYDIGQSEVLADLSEEQLSKLCSAAAILGRVAFKDNNISEEEKEKMISILQSEWNIGSAEATLLIEIVDKRVSEGMDFQHLTCSFFESTTYDERKSFLKSLFQIANASEKTSLNEIEEIRFIAQQLKLSHSDFIEAKLTIPREDRKGL